MTFSNAPHTPSGLKNASRIGAQALVTRDVLGFKDSAVKVYSPAELIDELCKRGLEYEEVISS